MSLKTLQNFYKATTSRAWAIGTGNRYVSTLPTPSAGYLVISPSDTTKREIIAYSGTGTDSNGSYVTVTTRGVGGTTEQAHTKGEPVRMNIIAQHYSEVQDEVTGLQGQIDTLVLQNAPNASTTVRGIVLMSTAPSEDGTAIVVATTDPKYTKIDDIPDHFVSVSTGAGDAGSGVVLNASGLVDGTLLSNPVTIQTFTSNGTWTKPAGLHYVVAELLGGGGGGGGYGSNSVSPNLGGGGGAGCYGRWIIPASSLGATETITIGTAGTAGSGAGTEGGNGGTGGATSIGTVAIAGGGVGGVNAGSGGTGGAGGTASGSVSASFSATRDGFNFMSNGAVTVSGAGADTLFGTGGRWIGTDRDGEAGKGYGAGGSGAGGQSQAGGAGLPGLVIITEYYN